MMSDDYPDPAELKVVYGGKKMTAQLSELLLYKGEKLALFSEPLEAYFSTITPRPEFSGHATCCDRGYLGTWEIDEGRLYLTEIRDWELKIVDGSCTSVPCRPTLLDGTEVTLASLFPESDGARVFAGWYSGELRCPQGERVRYVHCGFGSVYERDLLIRVENGEFVSEQVRENTEEIRLQEQRRLLMSENQNLDIPAFLRKYSGPQFPDSDLILLCQIAHKTTPDVI